MESPIIERRTTMPQDSPTDGTPGPITDSSPAADSRPPKGGSACTDDWCWPLHWWFRWLAGVSMCKLTSFCWIAVAVQAALLIAFITVHARQQGLSAGTSSEWLDAIHTSLLILVVVLPPTFYPLVYFSLPVSSYSRRFVKDLAERWGPLWAAVSLLCIAFGS